jgi:hypothetical protein
VVNSGDFDNYLKVQYEKIHSEMIKIPQNSRLFNGSMALTYKNELTAITKKYNLSSWFDFGAGNSAASVMSLSKNIGIEIYHWHDLGVENHSQNKLDKYDLVTSFDVLEHIHVAKIPSIVKSLFEKSNKVIFCSISSRLASAELPDGNNAHITLYPFEWWGGYFILSRVISQR